MDREGGYYDESANAISTRSDRLACGDHPRAPRHDYDAAVEASTVAERKRRRMSQLHSVFFFDIFPMHVAPYCSLNAVVASSLTCRSLYVALSAPGVWRGRLANDFSIDVDAIGANYEAWSARMHRQATSFPCDTTAAADHQDEMAMLMSTEQRLWAPPYAWKSLYAYIYGGRVGNWQRKLKPRREAAATLARAGNYPAAAYELSAAVYWQWQGGTLGGLEPLRRGFAQDLLLRGRAFTAVGNYTSALGDFALSVLIAVDPDVVDECTRRAADILSHHSDTGDLLQYRNKICSTGYDFNVQYDALLSHGTLFDRASFLHQVTFWRDATYEVALHQYLLCDLLRAWPEWLVLRARSLARQPYQILICDAWLNYDRRQNEAAVRCAEQAVASLPPSVVSAVNDIRAFTPHEMTAHFSTGQTLSQEASFAYFTLGFVAQYGARAIEAYTLHLRSCPAPGRRAVTCNNLGFLCYHDGDYALGLQWLKLASAANPKYFMAYKNAAKCHDKLGDRQAAYQTMCTAAQLCDPQLADLYSERSKYSLIVSADLNRASKMNPRLSYPCRFRSAMLMDSGEGSQAIKELNDVIALTLDPNDICLRAEFLLDLGSAELAIDDIILAATLAPHNGDFRLWLERHGSGAPILAPVAMGGHPLRTRIAEEAEDPVPPTAPKTACRDPHIKDNYSVVISIFVPPAPCWSQSVPRAPSSSVATTELNESSASPDRPQTPTRRASSSARSASVDEATFSFWQDRTPIKLLQSTPKKRRGSSTRKED